MRDLNELNLNEGGRCVATPPPTAHQFAVVERLVGTTLPEAYVRFLQFSNGGHPELNLYEVEIDGQRFGWGVNNFFHIASDVETTDDVGDVVWNYHHRWPGAPRELLPIARDGGGNLFCLDLTEAGRCGVVIQVHDEPGFPIVLLANSFEQFIDGLTTDPDAI